MVQNAQPEDPREMLHKHRDYLIDGARKAQESYDKALLSLSGGAMGVSLIFLKDIFSVSQKPLVAGWAIILAWVCWVISLIAILTSFATSRTSFVAKIEQVDAALRSGNIDLAYQSLKPSGFLAFFKFSTQVLNGVSGLGFVLGVIFMAILVYANWR